MIKQSKLALMLTAALASSSPLAGYADTTLALTVKNAEGARFFIQSIPMSRNSQSEEMDATDKGFTYDLEDSPSGLYSLSCIYNKAQYIVPIYVDNSKDKVKLTVNITKNGLSIKNDKNNRALSDYGAIAVQNDRKLWSERPTDAATIDAILNRYQQAADSVLKANKCNDAVQEYIKLWSYTSMYNSLTSLPNITRTAPDKLPINAQGYIGDPTQKLDMPLATAFAITPSIVYNTLPQDGSLDERMAALYNNFKCDEIRKKVGNQLVEQFVSRYNYQNDFDGGLAQLKSVVEKYDLNEEPVQTFIAHRATIKGNPFPEGLKFEDLNGNEVTMEQFKGKWVYLDLWASWCGPCCYEIPHLKTLEKELNNPEVVFVSISLDQNRDAWLEKSEALNLHGNQLHDNNEMLGKALNISGIPFFAIYDKDGNLYQYNAPRPSSGSVLKSLLEDLK
jgi:thiol-disulfide isomerase/thioredoxin